MLVTCEINLEHLCSDGGFTRSHVKISYDVLISFSWASTAQLT